MFSATGTLRRDQISKSGCPYDNAVAGNIFCNIQKGRAYRRDYSSETDFRKSIKTYINFYNVARPHQTLAYKTPSRFEELYRKEKAQDL
ncbi:MAG: transposase [Lachnospiraceae bacterium]|nr:transposase [Acutalibacter sp.]MCI9336642.1 transposase [Lachnospiraceae bacterium]